MANETSQENGAVDGSGRQNIQYCSRGRQHSRRLIDPEKTPAPEPENGREPIKLT